MGKTQAGLGTDKKSCSDKGKGELRRMQCNFAFIHLKKTQKTKGAKTKTQLFPTVSD